MRMCHSDLPSPTPTCIEHAAVAAHLFCARGHHIAVLHLAADELQFAKLT